MVLYTFLCVIQIPTLQAMAGTDKLILIDDGEHLVAQSRLKWGIIHTQIALSLFQSSLLK